MRDSARKIILGVDRLDYTKGLGHRLKAFEKFLEKHPEHIEQVTHQFRFAILNQFHADDVSSMSLRRALAGNLHANSRAVANRRQGVPGSEGGNRSDHRPHQRQILDGQLGAHSLHLRMRFPGKT